MLRLILAILLITAPAAVHADAARIESDNFVFFGDNGGDRLLRFADKVERFDALLRVLTGLKDRGPQPNKLTIFVVATAEAVRKQGGVASRTAVGVYRPSISGSIAVVPRAVSSGSGSFTADVVLFHEYVHHFMLQYFPAAYPPWYVEGFAEYLSTTEFKSDGSIHVGLPANFRAYGLIEGAPFPVARLLSRDIGTLNDSDVDKFYGWSWLLTHYLSISPDRAGQLTAYLAAFNAGKAPEVAAASAFGDIAKLQSDLIRYRDRRMISYRKLTGLTLETSKLTVTPLDATEEALLPLFVRFSRGVRGKAEAEAFAAEARAATARAPKHPRALELLAEGELDVDRFDAATQANDMLIALQPGNARALLRRARIAIARLDGGGNEAAWKAVRVLVARANRANPNDPWPLAEFYRTFTKAGVRPPEMAVNGLLRAFELAPQDRDVRFMLARDLIAQKRTTAAANVLAPLLNDPHSANVRATARTLLDGSIPMTVPDLTKATSDTPE